MAMRSPRQRPTTLPPAKSPPPAPVEADASSTSSAAPVPGWFASCSHCFRPQPSLCGLRYSLRSRFTILWYCPMVRLLLSRGSADCRSCPPRDEHGLQSVLADGFDVAPDRNAKLFVVESGRHPQCVAAGLEHFADVHDVDLDSAARGVVGALDSLVDFLLLAFACGGLLLFREKRVENRVVKIRHCQTPCVQHADVDADVVHAFQRQQVAKLTHGRVARSVPPSRSIRRRTRRRKARAASWPARRC